MFKFVKVNLPRIFISINIKKKYRKDYSVAYFKLRIECLMNDCF